MKPIEFRGTALVDLRDFPQSIKRDAGYQLGKVQNGLPPDDFKPMKTIGAGVVELRIRDEAGAFRVVCMSPSLKTPCMCCTVSRKRPRRPASVM